MPEVDLHDWFSEEELEFCPLCGELSALRIEVTEALLCIDCGIVPGGDRNTTVERLEPHDSHGA